MFPGSNPKTTKKTIEISDSIISRPETELIGCKENNVNDTDNKVRKRTKPKPSKDVDRTLMISREPVKTKEQTGFKDDSQTGSSEKNKNIKTDSIDGAKNRTEILVNSKDKIENTGAKLKVSAKVKDNAVENKKSDATNGLAEGKDSQDAEIWSQNQQVILEWALRQYPKGVEQRWEKIAEHIPGKNKVSGATMILLIGCSNCIGV